MAARTDPAFATALAAAEKVDLGGDRSFPALRRSGTSTVFLATPLLLKSFFRWLVRNRSSPRAAFGLRMSCMVTGMVLSLLWSRALLHRLGPDNFGLLSSF